MESSNAWMRDGLKSHVNTEDYLLGKTIDRNFELFSDVVIKEEVGTLESIKAKYRDGHSNFMSSVKEISKEDPMIAVKVSEVQRMEGILQNPVFKLKIEKYLRKEFDKYYNGQIAMTPTTVAGGLTSRREMITERRSRSPQFSKRTDHSVEEDWRKMHHSRSHQSSRTEVKSSKHSRRHDYDKSPETSRRRRYSASKSPETSRRRRYSTSKSPEDNGRTEKSRPNLEETLGSNYKSRRCSRSNSPVTGKAVHSDSISPMKKPKHNRDHSNPRSNKSDYDRKPSNSRYEKTPHGKTKTTLSMQEMEIKRQEMLEDGKKHEEERKGILSKIAQVNKIAEEAEDAARANPLTKKFSSTITESSLESRVKSRKHYNQKSREDF
uniref:Arginine/serine-rich coiled-coil protein 2 n=1 Tax=Rhabditophanes sp. KR3021 TaxID=114890 RepID=A0AC35UF73_9BILA